MTGVRGRTPASSSFLALVLFGAMSLFVLFFGRYLHEPWTDEVQAYLIAHTTSLHELIEVLELEGVAPLYHLTVRALSVLLPPFWVLPVVSAVGYASLLFGVRALLLSVTRKPLASTLLACAFGVTDTFVQELGIIARSYGLGLGLALLACAYVFRAAAGEANSVKRASIWVAVSMLFSVQGGCVSGGAFLALFLRGRGNREREALWKWAPLPLFALLVDAFFIRPNANRTSHQTLFHVSSLRELLERAGDLIADGIGASGWWPGDWRFGSKSMLVVPVCTGVVGGVLLGAFGSRASSKRGVRTLTLGFLFGTFATLFIQLFFNTGFYRHHLFLVQPWLVLSASALLEPRNARGARLLFAGCFVPLLIHEERVLYNDLVSDAEGAFSETRAFQAQLPQGARVVVHAQDAIGLGLLLGRDDITYRSSKNHGGAYTRFARVDRHWQDEGHLIDLVESECAQAHDRTYVVVNKRTGFPLRPSAGEQVILPRRPFLDLQPIDAYRVVCEALYKPSK